MLNSHKGVPQLFGGVKRPRKGTEKFWVPETILGEGGWGRPPPNAKDRFDNPWVQRLKTLQSPIGGGKESSEKEKGPNKTREGFKPREPTRRKGG